MQLTSTNAIGVGQFTAWGQAFLGRLQQQAVEFTFEEDVDRFIESASWIESEIVFIENQSESQQWIEKLRDGKRRLYLIWIGESFSKEDYEFAYEHRVYAIYEGQAVGEEQIYAAVQKLSNLVVEEKRYDVLVRSMKGALLEAQGDIAASLMSELKTAVTKLGEYGILNEFAVGKSGSLKQGDQKLLFHESGDLAEALGVVDSLERTGVLWVRTEEEGDEGQIEFIQGKVIAAKIGEVSGLKAIYRMFLWDNPKFLFTRREPGNLELPKNIDSNMQEILTEGAQLLKRYGRIRDELPPNHVQLQMNVQKIKNNLTLDPSHFSALASVIEYQKVGNILNFNVLPDVILLESLIELRKMELIRVVA